MRPGAMAHITPGEQDWAGRNGPESAACCVNTLSLVVERSVGDIVGCWYCVCVNINVTMQHLRHPYHAHGTYSHTGLCSCRSVLLLLLVADVVVVGLVLADDCCMAHED